MTEDLRIPARQSGDGREWPRLKPVFSVLAVALAMTGGACQFAYLFKTHWMPLQRLYFPTYFETAHFAHSSNRNLRPPRSASLLLVAFSTVHATSAQQGLSRFTSCVLQSGIDLPYHAIKSNIADSLNIIVQLERRPGQRFVSEVLEIKGYDPEADRYDFTALYLREEGICRH